MAGFRYPLQPVLERYVARETAAARQYLAAHDELKRELAVLKSLEREAMRAHRCNGALNGDHATAGELADLERRRRHLELACRRSVDRIDSAKANVDQILGDFERAIRKRMHLERHRERRLTLYREEQARRDEAELDDANALLPGCAPSIAK